MTTYREEEANLTIKYIHIFNKTMWDCIIIIIKTLL